MRKASIQRSCSRWNRNKYDRANESKRSTCEEVYAQTRSFEKSNADTRCPSLSEGVGDAMCFVLCEVLWLSTAMPRNDGTVPLESELSCVPFDKSVYFSCSHRFLLPKHFLKLLS